MINVVYNIGRNRGMDTSLNIISITHTKNIFTKNPTSPKVMILNGRVIAFNTGFTK